jgi:hypothetical protein
MWNRLMTSKIFQRLARQYLLPSLPGIEMTGRLLYQAPVGDLLCGCHFESSSYEKESFVVTAFVQPLYVPAGHLVLSYGKRLGGARGDHWWRLGQDDAAVMAGVLADIETQAPPIHALGGSPLAFAEEGVRRGAMNFRDREAIAYSYLRVGQMQRGVEELERCLGSILQSDLQIPWVAELQERNRIMLHDAHADPSAVQARLSAWRAETLAELRIAA